MIRKVAAQGALLIFLGFAPIFLPSSTHHDAAVDDNEKLSVYYYPFSRTSFYPINKDSIEERFNITTLVRPKRNELMKIVSPPNSNRENCILEESTIRLKISGQKHDILVDTQGCVSRGENSSRMSKDELVNLRKFIGSTMPAPEF